jgi:hypothetical protein
MLTATVNLNRKITRDYNSTGYGVSIEGEINAPLDDPEAVLERIKELWSVAEESLAVEIDRDQSESAIGRRDEEPQPPSNPRTANTPVPPPNRSQQQSRGNGDSRRGNDETATNKQCQYLLNIAKRQRLSTQALEGKIEQIIGHPSGVYQLTKREAGMVIDALTGRGTSDSNADQRR